MRKNNRGVAIVNIILLVLILICGVFIGLTIFSNDNLDIGTNNEAMLNSSKTENTAKLPVTNHNKVQEENVTLSNSIFGNTSDNPTQNKSNEAKKYYYNQLNSVGKKIYETIEDNVSIIKSGTGAIKININDSNAGNYIQTAWDAFSLDRPDIFWVDTNNLIQNTKTTTYLTSVKYEYTLEPENGKTYFNDYFKSSNQVENAINEVNSKINSIAMSATGNSYDKVKYVHDELIRMIQYNQNESANNSNIYGAFVENLCVCEGYAEAFKIILDKLEIPCVTIYGEGIDGEGQTEAHAWNYVKMDNEKWYAVDTTWDDPIIIGNGDTSGINRYKYFLKGSSNFLPTHRPNGDVSETGQIFNYPTLSETDYR